MGKKELKMPLSNILLRGHYLYFGLYHLYGKVMDFRIGRVSMDKTIFNREADAYGVQCISYPYLRAFVKQLDWSKEDVFVDIGCAWGRLLGYLEKKTAIRKLVGIELNEEAAETAKKIFKKSARVQIIAGDAVSEMPSDGTILYMFNPFGERTLCSVLDKIEEIYDHPVRVFYLYPTCRQVLDTRKDRWELVKETRLKPRHLGPLLLCEYVLKKQGGASEGP